LEPLQGRDAEPPDVRESGRRISMGSVGSAGAGMAVLHSVTAAPEDIAELARQHEEEEEADKGASVDDESTSDGERSKAHDSEEADSHSPHDIRMGEEGMLTAKRKVYTARASFSLLEKLMLLQEVKIFRYVPLEYLPDLAKCAVAVYKERGAMIVTEGEATNGTLYIVADGVLGLLKNRGETLDAPSPWASKASAPVERSLLRKLWTSDTMGNTALLHDSIWLYSAVALEDTWLLSIDRAQLADVLRGRRDLASAVIHGLYKTFTRRIKNAVFAGIAPTSFDMGMTGIQ